MIGHNHLGKNGRFGNQMFQYAATRGIAAKHNYDWCIPDGPKTDEEFEDEENQHKLFMAFKMGGVKTINMHPAPYKQEGSFTFDQDLFDNCEDNINLYGYFQCEKYFKHIEDEIRKDFEWRDDGKKLCQDMFDSIVAKPYHYISEEQIILLNQHIILCYLYHIMKKHYLSSQVIFL